MNNITNIENKFLRMVLHNYFIPNEGWEEHMLGSILEKLGGRISEHDFESDETIRESVKNWHEDHEFCDICGGIFLVSEMIIEEYDDSKCYSCKDCK